MVEVERLRQASAITVAIEPSDSDDALWCLDQYYQELDRRFENGFDQSLGNSSTSEDFARRTASSWLPATAKRPWAAAR
jgi:hypothetical protein